MVTDTLFFPIFDYETLTDAADGELLALLARHRESLRKGGQARPFLTIFRACPPAIAGRVFFSIRAYNHEHPMPARLWRGMFIST
jgi:hypothetical protein